MTNLWLYGTIIPLAVIAYIFIARMAFHWAEGRWPDNPDVYHDDGPFFMFSIFWPLMIPIWALFHFLLIPMWHSWDGFGDKMKEFGKKHQPEDE